MVRPKRSSAKYEQPCSVEVSKPITRNSERLRNITNTLKMSSEACDELSDKSSQEPSRRKKKPSSATIVSDVQLSSNQPEMVAFEKLRVVLGRHYFDVCQRLNLDYVPRCVRNVTACAQKHANKRLSGPKRVGLMRQNHTLEQISEHRPDKFVEFLYQALMRVEFIDCQLFVAGLQLMLTINRPSAELQVDYDVPSIISETSDALEKAIEQYPPCMSNLRSTYRSIVFGHLDAECFNKCDHKEGLFRNVIHLLEYCIEADEPEQTGGRPKKRKDTSGDDVNDAYFSNYSSWMTQNSQIYDFDKLPRVERFERLFAVLKILVLLLEMDLAMWTLRNPTKTRQNLSHPSRCPLVAQVVWDGDTGSINLFVKKLFQIFINFNALGYPEEDISVFSRLLNLVAVSVNLSEFQHNDGMLQYPCLKTNSQYFGKQLWKALESSPYYTVNNCMLTIHRLRTPYVKLLLSEELLRKLNRLDHPTNVRGFFQLVLSRYWSHYGDEIHIAKSPDVRHRTLYPTLNHQKKRAKSSTISRQQYVDLLFVGFRAYCDLYQIPAYFREIIVQPVPIARVHPQEASATFDPSQTTFGASPQALQQYIRQRATSIPGNSRIATEAVADERMIFQGIAVNGELVLEYREDIKYLMLIEQELKKLDCPEERVLFHNWIAFLSDIDPSLNISTA